MSGRTALLLFCDQDSTPCRAALAELQAFWAERPDSVLPISVHWPRGEADGSDAALRRAVLRREIAHPVVNDGSGRLRAAFTAKSRPTVVALGPDGAELGRREGAFDRAALRALATAPAAAAPPLKLSLERDREKPAALAAPSRLASDGKRLFIADTNHNRVVVADPAGRVRAVIGDGSAGMVDASLSASSFDHPEGLAIAGETLYVADSGNHLVRRIDLDAGKVWTMIEDGSLRRPTDLAFGGRLFIASSGNNQVRILESAGATAHLAGGAPGVRDGALPYARFAEPAGLALDGQSLFVVDSASGSVRVIELDGGAVKTIAPAGTLARPLAAAVAPGALFIADAGSGRIVKLDAATGKAATVAEGLLEPSGLAILGGRLIVSESGRDSLLSMALDGTDRKPFELSGLAPAPDFPPMAAFPPAAERALPFARVRAGAGSSIVIDFKPPEGWRLNPRAAIRYRVSETRGAIRFDSATRRAWGVGLKPPLRLKFDASEGESAAFLNLDYQLCRNDGTGVSRAHSVIYKVLVEAAPKERAREIRLSVAPD